MVSHFKNPKTICQRYQELHKARDTLEDQHDLALQAIHQSTNPWFAVLARTFPEISNGRTHERTDPEKT